MLRAQPGTDPAFGLQGASRRAQSSRRSRSLRNGAVTYHELVADQRGGAAKNGKRPATASERILDAAMREFARYGFAGARVERIVSRADVSPRSLYYHFGSKRGLYDAVRERLSSQHFDDFVRGVTTEPLVDRLIANIDVAMTPRWQQWARLLMWEALDGSAGSAPHPDGTVPGDLLAICAAQERGEIDPDLDPHVLTLTFIAITFWPTMFPQSTKRLTRGMPAGELLQARKDLVRAIVKRLGDGPQAELPAAVAPGAEEPR